MAKLIGETYSRALFEVGVEAEKIEEYYDDINGVCTLIRDNKKILQLLVSPRISIKEKKSIIENIFGGKINGQVINFLKILIDKKRMEQIFHIEEKYEETMLEYKGIIKAAVYSTDIIDEDQKDMLVKKLEKVTGKKVQLETLIDQSLLGGICLKIGDKIIDGSVRRQLDNMEKIFKEIII